MRITVIGTGYVGLTTGLTLAYLGHEVVGVDKDPAKLDILHAGKSPIHEDGMDELLTHVLDSIRFTDDLRASVVEAEVIMIAVGTPPKPTGEADTSFVEAAAVEVAQGLEAGRDYVIVVKSTVPIGTNKRLRQLMARELDERGIETTVHITSNPEFLREGRALSDSFYPDRICVGTLAPAAEATLFQMYKPILEQSFRAPNFTPRPQGYQPPHMITTDPTSAEISKYASNAFLATKISFINEISRLCEHVGADATQVARVMGKDHRIGPYFLHPGLGWGGSCLPKDTSALQAVASEYGYDMPIIEAARQINWAQRQLILEKLQTVLKVLRGNTIAVLGLAFKPNTDDVRDSASVAIVQMLSERGAHCRVHDPVAMPFAKPALESCSVEFAADAYAAARGADAILLATEWPEYLELDLRRLAESMPVPVMVDGRNLFEPADARAAGFEYLGVGR